MRFKWGVFLCAAMATCSFGAQVTIFNTGENQDGSLATPGLADPNYTDLAGNTVYVLTEPDLSAWVNPDTTAQYIGPDPFDGSVFDSGSYNLDYLVSFDLTGFDPSTVVIDGQWSTDNLGDNISINGTPTGDTSPGFSSFTPFTISSGFVPGVNTLDFNWENDGGPGGMLVEFTSATGTQDTTAPEPATITLLAAGLAALVFGRRRRLALP
jgi:PEP-CTERM motif-containing protein